MLRKGQKSEFVSGLGTGFEFVKAISDEVRKLGGNDDDLRKVIAQATLRRNLARMIMGLHENVFPSITTASDLIPEYTDAEGKKMKWDVLEDVQPTNFKIVDLELVPFLEGGETYIDGETMRTRAVKLNANLGLCDAKYLLDNQSEIPTEFRSKVLVFTGTLFRGSGGGLLVAYLFFDDGRWDLYFCRVDRVWYDDLRLMRCK